MGGGLVRGSVTLISGSPGIGKSTLMLQVAFSLAEKQSQILYVSGEESLAQIHMRGVRLGALHPNISLVAETELNAVESTITEANPDIVIVDSIQTLFLNTCDGIPGSVSQVKESTSRLVRLAKEKDISFFYCRTCYQGREYCGPANNGTYGGYSTAI